MKGEQNNPNLTLIGILDFRAGHLLTVVKCKNIMFVQLMLQCFTWSFFWK